MKFLEKNNITNKNFWHDFINKAVLKLFLSSSLVFLVEEELTMNCYAKFQFRIEKNFRIVKVKINKFIPGSYEFSQMS